VTRQPRVEAAKAFAVAVVALYVVVLPALSVAYALTAGAPIFARPPQVAALVVALAGSYPFVAGEWPLERLARFAIGLWVGSAALGLAGLAVLANVEGPLPSAPVARAAVLAVAYPFATLVAYRERLPFYREPVAREW
jgi:hypothetical protein